MRKNSAGIGRLSGAILLLALSAGLSGCGQAVEEYSVVGTTGEVSQVTTDPFSVIYPTLEYAKDEEVEGSSTPYGQTSEAAGGTNSAAEQEPERKWRTILEDVSLFSSPDSGKVVIVVPKGSKVDVLTEKENQWYRIRYHGTEGYVKSGYFVEDWEAEKEERQKREEEEARRKAEEERKRKEEEARKKAEAEKKRKEEEARKKAEEEAKKKAEEEKKKAEEEAKKKAAEEKKKKEEEAKKKAEEEAKKKAEEEAKKKAEEEAKKKAEEEAKKKAEEEAKKKAEEEAKKKAEEEAKKKAEEEAKKKAAEEKKKKEEEAKKKAAEEKKKKEEEAKKKAEEEAKRKAEEERARAMANGEVTRRLAETVNMRDPDNPEILYGIVPHGSIVTVLADLGDGWYLVDYDGMEGMISGGYFTEDDP